MTRRAKELSDALDGHRRDQTALVTLTLRHHAGIPLRVLRTLLGRAWSEMWAGRDGNLLREDLRLLGYVRGAEQTWGNNGWHPHLHCLLWFDGAPPAERVGRDGSWTDWISERWRAVVRQVHQRMWDCCLGCERAHLVEPPESHDRQCGCVQCCQRKAAHTLGARVAWGVKGDGTTLADRAREFRRQLKRMGGIEKILPDRRHGVRSELCTTGAAGRYLAKLGCELTGIMGKGAKPGHYTHWQLGQLASRGHQWAVRLWREHAEAMKGARHLTWSRGIRERLGLAPERPDEVLASETVIEPGDVDTPLAEIDAAVWDTIAKQQRQMFVASLHQAYHDGTLDRTLWGPSKLPKPDVPAPVWWNREAEHSRRRREGADRWAPLAAEAERREEQGIRPSSRAAMADVRDVLPNVPDHQREAVELRLRHVSEDARESAEPPIRPYVSRERREELREELRHHLAFDGVLSCPF